MRNSVHTLDILKSLGFTYYLDEASRDEPFIVPVKGGDFVTVPYTFHMNDIVSFPFEGWNPAAYEQALMRQAAERAPEAPPLPQVGDKVIPSSLRWQENAYFIANPTLELVNTELRNIVEELSRGQRPEYGSNL